MNQADEILDEICKLECPKNRIKINKILDELVSIKNAIEELKIDYGKKAIKEGEDVLFDLGYKIHSYHQEADRMIMDLKSVLSFELGRLGFKVEIFCAMDRSLSLLQQGYVYNINDEFQGDGTINRIQTLKHKK